VTIRCASEAVQWKLSPPGQTHVTGHLDIDFSPAK
jgi:hypothetical protein